MTYFTEGEWLRSTVDAQGMKKGKIYKVVGIQEMITPFGNFVTYSVWNERDDKTIPIGNAHLVMERVQ